MRRIDTDYRKRRCTLCLRSKPVQGGTGQRPGRSGAFLWWHCAECQEKAKLNDR